MPHTSEQSAESPALSAAGLRRVLVMLCLTETTSYGVLYYAFPVLAPAITADTGWSTTVTTAAFSTGLIISALAGIPLGRILDRSGPRVVMTTGSMLAVLAVLGIAWAPTLPYFFASWVLAGLAMAGTLYPPAFAALTRWWGPRRVTALTALTLIAGLASTIFAPLTAALVDPLGWRQTYVVLAVILAVLTVPAHLIGLRGEWPRPDDAATDVVAPADTARSRPFVLLVITIALASLTAYAVIVNLVPLLVERGMSLQTAAWALGLGGLGQVLGRLGYGRLTAATSVRSRGVIILSASATATALLALLPGPAPLLIAVAMFAGAARGLFTLMHATAISDRWGTTHYGRLAGLLSAPAMLATALAPWIGATLAPSFGGYPAVFAAMAVVSAVAAILILGTMPTRSPSHDAASDTPTQITHGKSRRPGTRPTRNRSARSTAVRA